MNKLQSLILTSLLVLSASCACAQDLGKYTSFKLFGRDVQVHGFLSQGFVYSSNNNWLTMDSTNGSGAMTEGGLNVSMRLTDKFRIGAQAYSRNIGKLGRYRPQLDWAYGDYRFAEWFGIRGGKVKTSLGLYNDTQDQDFLRVFALLPQAVYPTDLRDSTIAHAGGDVYGTVGLKKGGSVSYTLFAGQRNDTRHGGYILMLRNSGINYKDYGGLQYGGDVRWNTPLKGFLAGVSGMKGDITGTGTWNSVSVEEHSKKDTTTQMYAQYTIGNLTLDTEYRRYWRDQIALNNLLEVTTDTRGWYLAGAYRLHKRVAVGAYYSRFTNVYGNPPAAIKTDTSGPDHHLYDKVASCRFDLTSNWNVKFEGHFMDGYGSPGMYPDGFYTFNNPQGLKPKSNALIIRTGWSF